MIKRFKTFWNGLFNDFHVTTLTQKTTLKAFIFLLIFYIFGGSLVSGLYNVDYDIPESLILFLIFLVAEIIPFLLVLGYIQTKKQRQNITYIFKGIWVQIKRWVKIFINDLKKHWILIISISVVLYLLMILSQFLLSLLYVQNNTVTTTSSSNTLNNLTSIIFPLLIAPIFEEVMYRKLMPFEIERFFHQLVSQRTSRLIAVIFSALVFAGSHNNTTTIALPLFSTYIVAALVLQYVAFKTKSLTAPIMIHMGINIITAITMFI
ncbi:CPBP family intramembrane glutamic endopeptidase [Apilactobacillus timberlakei]|uniref:CPBP family intramembrane glutamic endopeptidase n=1 Tax=Apilactobacillus timberlakei TaxID=2008380 RepID=UPI001129D7D4|nr:CPBP family intramembrane glutamic endopeptidase [Apilactobacillus timberlakei]TPR16716.1 CPBP family intramembrane metalloprotease [Apilactobacillus timberlakei]TPR21578.1 CPBP family intramembrane metalloprotease [Apilactobacillus timberlakei]